MSAARGMTASVRAVTRKIPIPTRAPIILTSSAVKRVKDIVEANPESIALKIGIRTRGCNGQSYTLDYATEKGKFDEEVNQDGVKLFIDSKALMSILGSEVDFIDDKLKKEFVFNNPNIKGTCGCGESFNI